MKCTDFYKQMRQLKIQALNELEQAVVAHGGTYSFTDSDGIITNDAPRIIVMFDWGTADADVKHVDCRDGQIKLTLEDEYGNELTCNDPEIDIPSPCQIQFITEAIAEPNKTINKLVSAIQHHKFNWQRYLDGAMYWGEPVITRPLSCSYGQIGYIVNLNGEDVIEYDWEMDKITRL